jgi:hypothetical protein
MLKTRLALVAFLQQGREINEGFPVSAFHAVARQFEKCLIWDVFYTNHPKCGCISGVAFFFITAYAPAVGFWLTITLSKGF